MNPRELNCRETGPRTVERSPYLSPRDLAERWRCSRTTAQRIAEQAHIGKVLLGGGKNGSVRYLRADVEAYEQARLF